MKPQNFLKLSVCFCISLHIVGLKCVLKLLKGKGVWQITICYMYYTNKLEKKNILS